MLTLTDSEKVRLNAVFPCVFTVMRSLTKRFALTQDDRQEVFLRICQRWTRYRAGADCADSTFVVLSAQWAAADIAKRRKIRTPTLPITGVDVIGEKSPQDHAIDRDRLAEVLLALGRTKHRDAYQMLTKWCYGESVPEIAESLSVSRSWVYNRMDLAISNIRSICHV